MKVILLLLACVGLHLANGDKATVDYYEQLINDKIQRAAAYQFPKDASAYRPHNQTPTVLGTFDFVVIGAGSSGAVAASRLSEISNWSVLLLEAGNQETSFTDIPVMVKYTRNLEYNWGFNTTPQSTCCLATGGVCPFSRGKSMGGSSAINSLVYSRGNKLDYARWAQLGNPGWSYEEVLPYFIKSEHSTLVGDAGYHGYSGYLNVETHNPISKKVSAFLNANKEMGRKIVDINGRQQTGSAYTPFNTIKGRRQSSAKAFLSPARSRLNLRILTNSYVTKVLIHKGTKTAYGVLFSHDNVQYMVLIKKEIILSAGVVGSPTILMHSGVGPMHHLKRLNIPVIKDLSVGYNMHDHFIFYNIFFTTSISDPKYTLRTSIRQYFNGTGPLTLPGYVQAMAFFHLSTNNTTSPDAEVTFLPISSLAAIAGVEIDTDWKTTDKRNADISQFVVALLHGKTRGRIYLTSNDPYIYPLIDSKCLRDKDNEDIETIYKATMEVLKLLNTEAFKRINANLMVNPLCTAYKFMSKDYWLCLIRQTAQNSYHGGGTCQMGPDPKKGAVVDNKLKVYGVRNLRVADTSIISVTLTGHMSAPAMMVGERVADFIKNEHGAY